MTKTLFLHFLALLGLLAGSMPASAHGAPAVREIDSRVVTDYTGAGDYGLGGRLEEGPDDLLALDAREAFDSFGKPGVVLRLTKQRENADAMERRIEMEFTAGPSVKRFSLATQDDKTYTHNLDGLVGPIPIGDGHPRALDMFLRYTTLGVAPGAVLKDFKLTSYAGSIKGDVMPGTWFYKGNEMPKSPTDASAGTGLSYTLKGPPPLISAVADVAELDLATSTTASLTLTISHELKALTQFANITVEAPDGINATLGAPSLILGLSDATRTRTSTLRVDRFGLEGNATIDVVVVSSLGGRITLTIPLLLPVPLVTEPAEIVDEHAGHTTRDAPGDPLDHKTHAHGEAPGPAGLLVVAALAAVVLVTGQRR